MNINYIFSSFIAHEALKTDNDRLAEYCIKMMKEDAGRQVSNQGGWQSNTIFDVSPEIKDIYNLAEERVNAVNAGIGYGGKKIIINGYWININGKENYNETHNHPGSFYAGVYYVSAKENQGDIIFFNPINYFGNYVYQNNIENFTPFNTPVWQASPRTGDFYIFPAYLDHCVRRNMTDENRISIAFNFCIDMGDKK